MLILPSKVVCINLDRRADRWQRRQQEFARHGLGPVERFSALDGDLLTKPAGWKHSAGAYGCLRSHLQVVTEARTANAPSVLIFEDDAVLDPDFQNKLNSFSKDVLGDWDMLYFGALHKDEPSMISEHVGRITKANSTYAYALRNTVFDAFIELNSRAENVIDMNSYQLQDRFNCYCFVPNLAWVEAEYSDVQNRLERHWYLEKSLVLFGAHVDQLLRQTSFVIAGADANSEFLKRYYEEYFAPLSEIVVARDFNEGLARSDPARKFVVLTESNIYLETLDIRANLRMCEQFDAATGFDHIIDLTDEQADVLRSTGLSRGIDVTKSVVSKNTQIHFLKRSSLEPANLQKDRIFQSPNHALRLSRD